MINKLNHFLSLLLVIGIFAITIYTSFLSDLKGCCVCGVINMFPYLAIIIVSIILSGLIAICVFIWDNSRKKLQGDKNSI